MFPPAQHLPFQEQSLVLFYTPWAAYNFISTRYFSLWQLIVLYLHFAPNTVWSCILNYCNVNKHVKVKNAFLFPKSVATENNNILAVNTIVLPMLQQSQYLVLNKNFQSAFCSLAYPSVCALIFSQIAVRHL